MPGTSMQPSEAPGTATSQSNAMNVSRGFGSARTPTAVAIVALVVLVVGLMMLPTTPLSGGPTSARASPGPVFSAPPSSGPAVVPAAHPIVAPAGVRAMSGFPRTVLVEPFTELWCEFCPFESQAMYPLEHSDPSSYMVVAELHPCATGNYSNCQDSWPTLDGIADYRASYYKLTGYPTVYFDGTHAVVGDVNSDPASVLSTVYAAAIAKAAAIPGNVSISQTAVFTAARTVTVHETINSDVTGPYWALSYLTENIDQNVSGVGGVHDIGNVVRASIINETVSLTAGETTTVSGTVALSSAWNASRLSAVSLVQDLSSKIVQNANEVPVTSFVTAVTDTAPTIYAGQNSTLTISVTNSTSSAPIAGASVMVSSSAGGSFTSTSGVTGSAGTFTTTYLAPARVTVQTDETITASVVATGGLGGTSQTASVDILVNPNIPPSAPTAITLLPVDQKVELSWTAPTSGASGLTYYVYRAAASSGPFTQIGTSTTPTFTDTGAASGFPYWYTVSALNTGGFSPNSTAVTASPVVSLSTGLPGAITWWLEIDNAVFNLTGAATVSLHLASGVYTYNYGVDSYDYLAPANSTGTLDLVGTPQRILAMFTPNYAIVQGTVAPGDATVTLNGTPVTLTNGAFSEVMVAGIYPLKVSSTGYQPFQTTITLTAGNTTTVPAISLHPPAQPGGGSVPSTGGLSGLELVALVAIGVVAVAAVAGALLLSRRSRRGGPGPGSP